MLGRNSGGSLWQPLACRRKLNREVCQSSSRLMEHLTQRRSQFELSHTLMTQPEACHHGCYTTQWRHSASSHTVWRRKTFHQQKIYSISLQKKTKTNKLLMLATYTVLSVAPILPHISTSHTYTALAILITSYCIPASGLWNMYPCVDLCLHTT